MEAKNSDAVMQICSLTILFSFGIKNDFFVHCVFVCVSKKPKQIGQLTHDGSTLVLRVWKIQQRDGRLFQATTKEKKAHQSFHKEN
jgi:hypothetical protein